MSHYRIAIHILPRRGILDPQGIAVANALHSLDFGSVSDVRIGKYILIETEADSAESARASADSMCRKLLANTVTEDFEIASVEAL